MAAIRNLPVLLIAFLFSVVQADAGSVRGTGESSEGTGDCSEPCTGNFWDDIGYPTECRLLHDFPEVANREGSSLFIKLPSGRSKVFADEGECWVAPSCRFYFLGAITPAHDVVAIWLGEEEGADALLLDRRTGAEITLGEFPQRNDDGRYWSVVDSSPLDGCSPDHSA